MGLAWIGIHNTPDCLVCQLFSTQTIIQPNKKLLLVSTPPDSDDGNLDKILAELEKKPEESNSSKDKKPKNPYEGKKDDDFHNYEYSDDIDLSDSEW